MSAVNISIVSSTALAGNGTLALVEDCGTYGLSELITSSGTNEVTDTCGASGAVPLNADVSYKQMIWRIANMGTDDIYVAFGTAPDAEEVTPNAATTAQKGVPAGAVAYFGVAAVGDFCAVINA